LCEKEITKKKSKSQTLKSSNTTTTTTTTTTTSTTSTTSTITSPSAQSERRNSVFGSIKRMSGFLTKSKESLSKEDLRRQRSASFIDLKLDAPTEDRDFSPTIGLYINNNIIIVDGFLLYCDERIYSHFDIKLFIDIPRDICLRRRITTKKTPQAYFDKLIWPSYQQYNASILNGQLSNVFMLNGERELDEIFSEAVSIVERQTNNIALNHVNNLNNDAESS